MQPRQLKLLAITLLIVLLSLAGFSAIAQSARLLNFLAAINNDHGEYIRLTNAILAVMCSTFLLWPGRGARLVGHWNDYIGLAFLTFFVQYGLRFIGLVSEPHVSPQTAEWIHYFIEALAYLASSLNNLLFLAAARILLNKNKKVQKLQSPPNQARIISYFILRWRSFRNSLPIWALPIALGTVVVWLTEIIVPYSSVAEDFVPYLRWVRVPDALFSLYCLSWFGYALALSFYIHRRKVLAGMAFIIPILYSACLLIYAANPFIAYTVSSTTPDATQTWIKKESYLDALNAIRQATDREFKLDDLKDAPALSRKITKGQDALSSYLRDPSNSLFPPVTGSSSSPPQELTDANLIFGLNKLLDNSSLYEEARFKQVKLEKDTKSFLTARASLDAGHIRVLNRRLLEDAFRAEIKHRVLPVEFLDGAVFAVLAPLKYVLFLPIFALYLLSISSTTDFRQALSKTTSRRQEYLSKDGILSVIGNSLKADEVHLLIRLPELQERQSKNEERVLNETWSVRAIPEGKRTPRIFPIKNDPLLHGVMQEHGRERIIRSKTQNADANGSSNYHALPETTALVPIKFNGGIIGVLRVIFRGYGKYYDGTLEQLNFMSELIAPSVQDFRIVSAVDKLGSRLNRAPGNKPTEHFKNAVEKLTTTLYALLSPTGIKLLIECGFSSLELILPRDGEVYELLKSQEISYKKKVPLVIPTKKEGPIRVEAELLSSRTEDGERYNIGSFILAIPEEKDEFAKPILAAYYLTQRMIASLTANGIHNAAQIFLSVLIQDLGVALNKESLSVEDWFETIDATAKKSGLLWTVASVGNGKTLRGQPEHIDIINELTDEERGVLLAKPISCIPHYSPASRTRHVIHLKLKNSQHQLWLGVEREKFGGELNVHSPWEKFLDKLANVAGNALITIEDRLRTEADRARDEEKRLKAAQDEWLKTVAAISALLMHQLVNMVKNQLSMAGEALEIVVTDFSAQNNQLFTALKAIEDSASEMQELVKAFNDVTKMDEHLSCSIKEAAQKAERLFQFVLRKMKIEVETNISPDIFAKLPSNVVALALASLIGNAIDAIESKGVIKIKAEIKGDAVLCHVTNSGPVLTKEIIDRLFEIGVSQKSGHSGWGLYLVSRSLDNYGGKIIRPEILSKETSFTLLLPAVTS